MRQRWGIIALLGFSLLITGCVRDAGSSFEPVAPGGDVNTPLPQVTPTIAPTEMEEMATATDDAGFEAQSATEEPTVDPDEPTQISITTIPPSSTPLPSPTTEPTVLPSRTPIPDSPATVPTEDTMAGGAESMLDDPTEQPTQLPITGPSGPVQIATSTPRPTFTPAVPVEETEAVEPAGTDDTESTDGGSALSPGETSDDGCTYVVRVGDNAFRIAVNNNITLEELQAANPSLAVANPIIQPGQELTIPGCGGGNRVETEATSAPGAPTGTPVPDGFVEYTVVAGDTLLAIANRYGTTIRAIQDANELLNPDRLSIGQVLLIPQTEEQLQEGSN